MTAASRAVGTILAALSFVVALAQPQPTTATLCIERREGDVAFIGTIVEGPSVETLFQTHEGVYRFSIDEVLWGDPGNGRVYNPPGYGQGGYPFEIGATYEVHADRAREGTRGYELPDGVTLSTDICTATKTVSRGLAAYLGGVAAWAWSLLPVRIGVALAVGIVVALLLRRRSRQAPTRRAAS